MKPLSAMVLVAAAALPACRPIGSGPGPYLPGTARPAPTIEAVSMNPQELPVWKIPNIPMSGEAYYAPDSYHVIAQVQDPEATRPKDPRQKYGSLTYTFTDQGTEIRRINDRGQDACSFFFPDGRHLIWTSTRDNPDMPIGSWDDARDYPKGAELYVSDLLGGHIRRLTHNALYEAEVSVSPDGRWILFGRQVDGHMDLWRMRPDGTAQRQITVTDEWDKGGAQFLPDSRTILYRAWKHSDFGVVEPLPMTIFTIRVDGTGLTQRTFTNDMNWSPYPTPDGRHYVFVRIVGEKNREIYLGDLAGGEPRRLTFNDGFDGFPAVSPDGNRMLFTRTVPGQYGVYTYVMDISSLHVGPR